MAECVTVTVLSKLNFIPVKNDSDYLLIGNIPALKAMAQCIVKERKNLFAEAKMYEAQAVAILQDELNQHQGDGEVVVPNFEPFGVGVPGVENLI